MEYEDEYDWLDDKSIEDDGLLIKDGDDILTIVQTRQEREAFEATLLTGGRCSPSCYADHRQTPKKSICSNCAESVLTIEDVAGICRQCALDRRRRTR